MTSDDSYEIFKEIIFLNHHHHGSNKNWWIIMRIEEILKSLVCKRQESHI